MNVIALTTFVGLALVGLAIAFFLHQTNSGSGAEQDALMPLDEETILKPNRNSDTAASQRKSEFP